MRMTLRGIPSCIETIRRLVQKNYGKAGSIQKVKRDPFVFVCCCCFLLFLHTKFALSPTKRAEVFCWNNSINFLSSATNPKMWYFLDMIGITNTLTHSSTFNMRRYNVAIQIQGISKCSWKGWSPPVPCPLLPTYCTCKRDNRNVLHLPLYIRCLCLHMEYHKYNFQLLLFKRLLIILYMYMYTSFLVYYFLDIGFIKFMKWRWRKTH